MRRRDPTLNLSSAEAMKMRLPKVDEPSAIAVGCRRGTLDVGPRLGDRAHPGRTWHDEPL